MLPVELLEAINVKSEIIAIRDRRDWQDWTLNLKEEDQVIREVRCRNGNVYHLDRKWTGDSPERCEVNGDLIKDRFIDGATKMGPWAKMSPKTHKTHGVGLGNGSWPNVREVWRGLGESHAKDVGKCLRRRNG